MTQGSAELTTSRLVLLHPGTDDQPLFVFPGITGEPDTFRDMASRLGEKRRVYGFHNIGALHECEPVREVDQLAQLYAAELRRVQPRGPYCLFGYSFGGVIAFEVARELTTHGEPVGLVIMADCPVPGYPQPAPAWQRARTHLHNLLAGARTRRGRLQYIAERLQNVQVRMRKLLGFGPRPEPNEESPLQLLRVNAALYEAYLHYQPTPQCVDVLFLTADTPPDWPTVRFDDPLLGWGRLLRGRISQCSVPGTHLSIFAAENVGVLTDRVREALASLSSSERAKGPTAVAST